MVALEKWWIKPDCFHWNMLCKKFAKDEIAGFGKNITLLCVVQPK